MKNSTNYYDTLITLYPLKAKVLNWIKYALDARVYYYGDHFKTPCKVNSFFLSYKIKRMIERIKHSSIEDYSNSILSNAYFTVNEKLKSEGVKIKSMPWCDGNIYTKKARYAIGIVESGNFNDLLSEKFHDSIVKFYDETKTFLTDNKIKFILLSNDMVVFHRIIIDAAKEVGIKTGIFLHGLPARYDCIDDSRADYLFVWGESLKKNYEIAGSKSNIKVVGHPLYNLNDFQSKEDNFEGDVLVLSQSVCGAPSISNEHKVSDRGLCIQHIYNVEHALKKMGYKKARLRLHPSENKKWYRTIMDNSFYELDNLDLVTSIKSSKYVIGPVSTVMLETMYCNRPYYTYVISNNENIYADELVEPFTENNKYMNLNLTVNDLIDSLKNKKCVDYRVLENYFQEAFDIKVIKKIIFG